MRPKCLPDLKSQARRVKMKGCDLERALERVSRIALTYRPEKVPGLKACLMKELTIDDLKDMLFRNFRLRMPLGELVALFKYMDADGSGSISYVEFLVFLTRLSIKEKSAEKLRVATENKAMIAKTRQREHDFEERFIKKVRLELPDTFTAHELQSSIEKISHVANLCLFERRQMLKTFDGQGSLDATAFAEQLRRNFGLRLNHGEVAAAMAVFDRDGSGTVDMTEFLRGFFGLVTLEPLHSDDDDDDDATVNSRSDVGGSAMRRVVAEVSTMAVERPRKDRGRADSHVTMDCGGSCGAPGSSGLGDISETSKRVVAGDKQRPFCGPWP